MNNDDQWRKDQERNRSRDQEYGQTHGSRDQAYGRRSDYRGDGTIAQRGFGNQRSGYDRGGNDRHGGIAGERVGHEYSSSSNNRYDQDQDQGRSGASRHNTYEDYEKPGFGNWGMPVRRQFTDQRDHGSDSRDDRGLLERAGDAVASWFGDDEAEHGHPQNQSRRERGGQSHRGRGPKGYIRSDERIREDVCERLTQDHHVDASEVEISVSGREVTLSGTVDSRAAKRRAEDIAESALGVTHVQNNLRVQQRGVPSGIGSNLGEAS